MRQSPALSGCGGGNSPPPSFLTQILSNPVNDGDIELDVNNISHVVQDSPSVFAGVNTITGSEFRAFLDFPLTGSGGVLGSAVIESATLDIFIDSILQPSAVSIPIRVDLVSFLPQTLLPSDYDLTIQPALASHPSFILPSDLNHHVSIDVTALMAQAQALGLSHFQIRVLEDFGTTVQDGLIEIDDAATNKAPSLQVVYR